MANNDQEPRKKGTFGDLRLPVSNKYIYPLTRRRMLTLGGLGGLAFLVYFFFNSLFLNDSFVSSGPLSSQHAKLENDCAACHQKFASVIDAKCSGCHEPSGKRTQIFDFAAHYIYRSGKKERPKTAKAKFASAGMPCFSCHPDHLGRAAPLTAVPDARCIGCHDFGSFNDDHPEFEFARDKKPDDRGLVFSHINHVNDYLPGKDFQKKCLECHLYQTGGQHFKPLDFNEQCRECHTKQLGGYRHKDRAALGNPSNKCKLCHVVSGVRIMAVQNEQTIFTRAQFNHQPHVMARNCLECHTEIPITRDMPGSPMADQSMTQNIPKISNCQECHAAGKTSNRCVTCHEFHPNKQARFAVAGGSE